MPRPKGSADLLENRRWRALALLDTGLSLNEVGRRIGSSASSVMRWRDARRRGGRKALKVRFSSGRPWKLSAAQRERLVRLLLEGPIAYGYRTNLWTTARIAEVISRQGGGLPDPRKRGGQYLVQPLDGSRGRQITNFDSEQILNFPLVAGRKEPLHTPRPYRLLRRPAPGIQPLSLTRMICPDAPQKLHQAIFNQCNNVTGGQKNNSPGTGNNSLSCWIQVAVIPVSSQMTDLIFWCNSNGVLIFQSPVIEI